MYYVCNANKHDKTVCSRHSIREDVLDRVIYQTVRHQIDLLLDVDKALRQFENLSWEKHKLKQLDASIEIQEEVVRKNNTLRLGIYEDLRAGLPFNFHDHVKAGFSLAFMLFLCYNNTRVVFAESPETLDI